MHIKRHCTNFNLRNQRCIFDKCSLIISERSPNVFCRRVFNELPEKLRKLNNIHSFKKGLHTFLLNKTYYSVDDFLQ